MTGFIDDIEKAAKENSNFRKVLFTGPHSQLVLMCLNVGEEIGMEIHEENDQFFRIEDGKAKVIINGEEYETEDDFAIVVPAGAEHNIINIGDEELKLYTIYSPAHHPDGTIHATKEDAEQAELEEHN
jgi:mannose-6-phosphate isomerase-like protein (cupin superfamily)